MCPAAKCPRGGGSRSDNRSGTGSGTAASDRTTAAATGIPPRISAEEERERQLSISKYVGDSSGPHSTGAAASGMLIIRNLRDSTRRGRRG